MKMPTAAESDTTSRLQPKAFSSGRISTPGVARTPAATRSEQKITPMTTKAYFWPKARRRVIVMLLTGTLQMQHPTYRSVTLSSHRTLRRSLGMTRKTAEPTDTAMADHPPRAADRIRKTARELFYREGIRAVGVDEIVARAGVTKPSLYRTYRSKDELTVAVLQESGETF